MDHDKVCRAMSEAGITDPKSKRGIDFCTEQCPYSYCVAMEANRKKCQTQENLAVAEKMFSSRTGCSGSSRETRGNESYHIHIPGKVEESQ